MILKRFFIKILALPVFLGMLSCVGILGFLFASTPIVHAEIAFSTGLKVAQSTSQEQKAPDIIKPEATKPEMGEVDIPDPQSASDAVEELENEIESDEVLSEESNSAQQDGLLENTNKPEAPPVVYSNLDTLPFPARKMHELILKASRSGDIEKLRPFIGYGDDVTMLSLGGFDDDPIDFLKSISGDPSGHEILAIITEILESDFVLIDEGTDREVYVWPYFYAYPLEKLTAKQRVQLFRLMTYGDYQEMESFGAYIFYRLGITPQGRWRFFVAGD